MSRTARPPAPKTLVEKERAAALRLSMPEPTAARDFIMLGFGRDGERYDTPIGRTLTRELLHRDTQHCPSVAVRFLPVDDVARSVLGRDFGGSHPTSPRRDATEPKGRPTRKRPRRRHG